MIYMWSSWNDFVVFANILDIYPWSGCSNKNKKMKVLPDICASWVRGDIWEKNVTTQMKCKNNARYIGKRGREIKQGNLPLNCWSLMISYFTQRFLDYLENLQVVWRLIFLYEFELQMTVSSDMDRSLSISDTRSLADDSDLAIHLWKCLVSIDVGSGLGPFQLQATIHILIVSDTHLCH